MSGMSSHCHCRPSQLGLEAKISATFFPRPNPQRSSLSWLPSRMWKICALPSLPSYPWQFVLWLSAAWLFSTCWPFSCSESSVKWIRNTIPLPDTTSRFLQKHGWMSRSHQTGNVISANDRLICEWRPSAFRPTSVWIGSCGSGVSIFTRASRKVREMHLDLNSSSSEVLFRRRCRTRI